MTILQVKIFSEYTNNEILERDVNHFLATLPSDSVKRLTQSESTTSFTDSDTLPTIERNITITIFYEVEV